MQRNISRKRGSQLVRLNARVTAAVRRKVFFFLAAILCFAGAGYFISGESAANDADAN